MPHVPGQFQEIIAVACHKYHSMLHRVSKHLIIGRCLRHYLWQNDRFVPMALQNIPDGTWHIMIEEKFHCACSLI